MRKIYESMAIYAITFGCQCLVYVTFSAIAKASLTIMGQHLGAGEKEASNKCFWTCLIINFLIVGIAAIIFILFPKQLLNAFSNDKVVIQNGIPYLIFLGIIMFPQSLTGNY